MIRKLILLTLFTAALYALSERVTAFASASPLYTEALKH